MGYTDRDHDRAAARLSADLRVMDENGRAASRAGSTWTAVRSRPTGGAGPAAQDERREGREPQW